MSLSLSYGQNASVTSQDNDPSLPSSPFLNQSNLIVSVQFNFPFITVGF